MKLVSGRIYRCLPYLTSQTFPTLELTGAATIYVSLSQKEPTSIADMTDVTSEVSVGFNTLHGQIRYICAVFGEGSAVNECGIVTSADYRGV